MPKTILVVEDDPAAQRLASLSLETAGYEVLAASNGLDGLRLAREARPDLVLLDIMLPGIDGFEVCHRLRGEADPTVAQIPVLMISAKSQESDREAGRKVGVNGYLTKPATPAEIVEAIETVLAGEERLSA